MFKRLGLTGIIFFAVSVFAGTIIMKDEEKISGVKIVSIEDGKITLEKDGTVRTVALAKIKGYYDTDIKDNGGFVEDLADYKLSSVKVEYPEQGKKDRKPTNFEISYRISKSADSKFNRLKTPYFYLYVMFQGDDEYGHRVVRAYCYPKEAKTQSSKKNYDKAAIISALGNFKRLTVYLDNLDTAKFEDSKISIQLKGAPDRKILAWHLDVYGNSDLIYEKTERTLETRVGQGEWWKNY